MASGQALRETVGSLVEGGRAGACALFDPESGEPTSYERLSENVASLTGLLRARGAGPGDRVALVMPNGTRSMETLLAILRLGAAAAPLNPAYTEDEHRFYLDDIAPRLLVVPEGEYAAARAACPPGTSVVELGRGRPARRAPTDEAADPDAVALLLHTSGTTSRPKLVPLLQRNLVASSRSIAGFYGLTAEDVSYCSMPLFHVHGLVASVLAQLSAGGAVVVPGRLSASAFWRDLAGLDVSWTTASPAIHRMLLDHRAATAPAAPALRFVRSCSSPLAPTLWAELEQRLEVPVVEAYGMTEGCHQITSNPLPPGERQPGSVGISAGADVRVVDERGADVGEGSAGEVVIRGPGVTPGYLGDASVNESAFVDGWFRTGDLGALVDGRLRLSGRLKEIIIRGGENISPYEVEEALLAHPAVVEAVCFGVPSDRYGEEVAAAVVLRAAAEPGEIASHCRVRLAAFKIPRTIVVVDGIPRTATGKLQRRRIAAMLGLG